MTSSVVNAEAADLSGLLVRAYDGEQILLPGSLVDSSALLRTLSADELSEGGGSAGDAGCSSLSLPPVELTFAGCNATALSAASLALSPGGLPLALRWQPNDSSGLTAAVDFLRCSQFLDIAILSAAGCSDLAAVLAHRCADEAEVSALFASGRIAAHVTTSHSCVREAEELTAAAPVLGDRGRRFVEAWADEACPLSKLPFECAREVLRKADAMVREDAGVRELVSALDLSTEVKYYSTNWKNAILRSAKCMDAIEVPWILLSNAHALEVVLARRGRYRGSTLLTFALAAQAVPEIGNLDVRLRSVQALGEIAAVGDHFAMDAILRVLAECGGATQSSPKKKAVQHDKDIDADCGDAMCCSSIDSCWRLRIAACEVFEKLSAFGSVGTEAMSTVVGVVDHRSYEVRQAAVAMLGRISTPGDPLATDALVRALGDDDWRVREAAVLATCSVAASRGKGKKGTEVQQIPAICNRLTDSNSNARQTIRKTLQALTAQAGLAVAKAIARALIHVAPGRRVPLLRRPSAEVRSSVVECLGDAIVAMSMHGQDLSQCGGLEEALRAAVGALTDRSVSVRRAVVSGLSPSAGESGPILPDVVRQRVAALAMSAVATESFDTTKEEFLHLLRVMATPGDETATQVACKAISGYETPLNVRQAAIAMLGSVAAKGDSLASACLVDALRDPQLENDTYHALETVLVRSTAEMKSLLNVALDATNTSCARGLALRCLNRVAQRGDVDVRAGALATLSDENPQLRVRALDTIAIVAEPGDVVVEDAVVACLSDPDSQVRERAVCVCELLLRNNDGEIVDAIAALVVSPEYCVRQTGLRTLLRICGRGNPAAINRVLPWLDTGHWPQRVAAMEALHMIAAPGDPEVVKYVVRHTAESDQTCRHIACEVLAHVVDPGHQLAVESLVERIVRDPSWIVREAAKMSLIALVTSAQKPLVEALLVHQNDEVTKAARDVLASCQISSKA